MLKFDSEICETCGGFGDCADGDCEEKLMGTYEVTLRIPVTVQQRFQYGPPEYWYWERILDKCFSDGFKQQITVTNCELITEVTQ